MATGPAWPSTVSWAKVAPECPGARHPVRERPFPRFLTTTQVGEGVPESSRQARRKEVARIALPGRDQGWWFVQRGTAQEVLPNTVSV